MSFLRTLSTLCFGLILIASSSCGILKKGQSGSSAKTAIVLDTIELAYSFEPNPVYQIPPDILIDIHHIELDLHFNWLRQEVIGTAKLSLSAYAKDRESIELDARGFEIQTLVYQINDTSYTPFYTYDNRKILIRPVDKLRVNDTAKVFIKYKARPADLEHETGVAITSNQGLYFINHDGQKVGVPQQIWTQGEPECNSSWFPSVDHPHEKITHEIFLTIDSNFHTISNGRLIYSEEHENGTRTDYWKQDKPHANYLVMIAIGEFSVVKDHWRNIPVWYYLDEKYKSDAMAIFGNTPKMLEFYSTRLGFDYPWDKYHQVVVKDFVSGAMENTSAVIHGDFVQLTQRELLDESHEDVIAHELFHHWFGDLVTCKSWSQLTLNEGFATYGEYLWEEHHYGLEEAQYHLKKDLNAYLVEANGGTKPLIRNHYNTPDDLFDSHTYQKGGRVLHMLRLELGDDVFFSSLKHYLNNHAYGSVELDDFRRSVEKTSGRSMRWFFDQWFEKEGHAQVEITYAQAEEQLSIIVTQKQPEDWPTYRINAPLVIGHEDESLDTILLPLANRSDTFTYNLDSSVIWYSVDPATDILWEKTEFKNTQIWAKQIANAPTHIGRLEGLNAVSDLDPDMASTHINNLLNDPFWLVRVRALQLILDQKLWNESIKAQLIELTQLDRKSNVRSKAYETLDSLSQDSKPFHVLYAYGLRDSALSVVRTCLSILNDRDPCFGAEQAKPLEDVEEGQISNWISRLYATCPKESYLGFFESRVIQLDGIQLYLMNNDFINYALGLGSESIVDRVVESMKNTFQLRENWWSSSSSISGLKAAINFYGAEIDRIEAMPETSLDELERLAQLRNKKADLSKMVEEFTEIHHNRPSPFSQ